VAATFDEKRRNTFISDAKKRGGMETRVLGVDFSGATDAGRSVWVTEARHTDTGLAVTDCYRAADEWGVDRERVHAGLVDLATDDFAVVGFDFPFSLPAALLADHCGGTWRGLVEWVSGAGPDDPDTFASTCRSSARAHTGDGTAALRRETDLRRAALCPYGKRVQHQTFYGIRNVLGPLADRDDVTVAPIQDGDGTRVVEVYPAATFGWLGLYREGYKGEDRERRAANLDGLRTCGVDPGGFREAYETSHDALDSLAAAVSAGRATGDPVRHGPREEGHIYV
jgi:predicted nuclease with RNAse H fold